MTRQRKTRSETIEALREKLAIMEAQEQAKRNGGEFVVQDDPTGEKTVARALRKRQTALRDAMEIINGREKTEDKPGLNPIDVKIANKRRQLEQLEKQRDIVRRQEATLPFDIERLQGLLDSLKNGLTDSIQIPDDLHTIEGEPPQQSVETADDTETALD